MPLAQCTKKREGTETLPYKIPSDFLLRKNPPPLISIKGRLSSGGLSRWRCAQIVGFDQYQKIASILDENALKEYNAYTLKYLGKNANLPNSNPRPIKFGIQAKEEYYYMRELLDLD